MILFKEIARILSPRGIFLILDFFSGSFLKAYKAMDIEELLGKIQQLGIEDVYHKPLKETDIDLGGFYRHF
jgi:ubiquinone/menaquinone biosynthesis C-methylase UbiE